MFPCLHVGHSSNPFQYLTTTESFVTILSTELWFTCVESVDEIDHQRVNFFKAMGWEFQLARK